MPRYDYDCPVCNEQVEIIKPMSDFDSEEVCPSCDAIMVKQLSTGVGTPNTDYSRTIVSHSLAMCPSQIPEHRRMFPDIKVRPDGCPEFDNFKTHDDYLKKVGIEKSPQRIRSQTRKVIKKGQ